MPKLRLTPIVYHLIRVNQEYILFLKKNTSCSAGGIYFYRFLRTYYYIFCFLNLNIHSNITKGNTLHKQLFCIIFSKIKHFISDFFRFSITNILQIICFKQLTRVKLIRIFGAISIHSIWFLLITYPVF